MLRVAVDATPLIGERTGIGVLVAGALRELAGHDDLDLRAFALSWRGRRALEALVPAGVGVVRWPLAAAPLQRIWAHVDGPVVEWWTGPVDVVHGTNFVVPPAARAAEVVSVHDLTALRFPELCQPVTLGYPALIRRALRRGAWVHTLSDAMAAEIVELLGAPRERVRVVAPGVAAPGVAAAGGAAAGVAAADPGSEVDATDRSGPDRSGPDRSGPDRPLIRLARLSAGPSPARTCRSWWPPSTRSRAATRTWISFSRARPGGVTTT